MNEKYLWELWFKCKHPHPEYGGGDMVWPMEFAELIVRECIAQCEKNKDHEWLGSGSKLSAFNIREHFGVEE